MVLVVVVAVVTLLHPHSMVRGAPSLVEAAVTSPGEMMRVTIPWRVHRPLGEISEQLKFRSSVFVLKFFIEL